MTPEGKVKKAIKDYLTEVDAFYWLPVSGGFGNSAVDIIGCYKGRFFAIEVKAPGGKPTMRQKMFLRRVFETGGYITVADHVDIVKTMIAEIKTDIQLEQAGNARSRC